MAKSFLMSQSFHFPTLAILFFIQLAALPDPVLSGYRDTECFLTKYYCTRSKRICGKNNGAESSCRLEEYVMMVDYCEVANDYCPYIDFKKTYGKSKYMQNHQKRSNKAAKQQDEQLRWKNLYRKADKRKQYGKSKKWNKKRMSRKNKLNKNINKNKRKQRNKTKINGREKLFNGKNKKRKKGKNKYQRKSKGKKYRTGKKKERKNGSKSQINRNRSRQVARSRRPANRADLWMDSCFERCYDPEKKCVAKKYGNGDCLSTEYSKKTAYRLEYSDVTKTGRKCLFWNVTKYKSSVDDPDQNACENPSNYEFGPWCYLNYSWEACFDVCKPSKCFDTDKKCVAKIFGDCFSNEYSKQTADKLAYSDVTKSGRKCLFWNSTKHRPSFKNPNQNACANPTNYEFGPWCYLNYSWEACFPICLPPNDKEWDCSDYEKANICLIPNATQEYGKRLEDDARNIGCDNIQYEFNRCRYTLESVLADEKNREN